MVILAVIFAIFLYGIKKLAVHMFFRNLHLLSFPTIYSLPCFPLKWRAYEFSSRGHGRTPAKIRNFALTDKQATFNNLTFFPG